MDLTAGLYEAYDGLHHCLFSVPRTPSPYLQVLPVKTLATEQEYVRFRDEPVIKEQDNFLFERITEEDLLLYVGWHTTHYFEDILKKASAAHF